MITKVYEVKTWKYDELSEEQKEKVLEHLWDINLDYDWWDCDGITGFTSKEISKHHLNDDECDDLLTYKKMYFDIDRNNYIQFVDCQFAYPETARKFLGIPKKLWDNVYWSFDNSRENTTRLEYENQDNYKEFTVKQIEILNNAVERFSDKMQEALNGLRKSYEYMGSREAIEDTIEANDYDFDERGHIA